MTDHYQESVDLVTEADEYREDLADEYALAVPRRDEVGRLNSLMKHCREQAGTHAVLALAQQLRALREDADALRLFDQAAS